MTEAKTTDMTTRYHAKFILLLPALVLMAVAQGVSARTDFLFDHDSRAALVDAGWSLIATTAAGSPRDTEQTSGATLSFDQVAHPGVLRIPVDTGDLWTYSNNTRNSLFQTLPSDWTSIRLGIASFAPTANWQQIGLVAYQDDDNYVSLTRVFNEGGKVSFIAETQAAANVIKSIAETATRDIQLRLDRNPATHLIRAYYSPDGENWRFLGSTTRNLSNPRLGIVTGGSGGGYPAADVAWAQIYRVADHVTPPPGALVLSSTSIVFNGIVGQASPAPQTIRVNEADTGEIDWQLQSNASWLRPSATTGITPDQVAVSVDTKGLSQGVHRAQLTFDGPGVANGPRKVDVALILNPASAVKVTTWQGGRKGALSFSTDDAWNHSCYSELISSGLAGSYFINGADDPWYLYGYHQDGMEIGGHTLSHTCNSYGEAALREELEKNLASICRSLGETEQCKEVVSFAWPCGMTTPLMQSVSRDYFMSARGYNINALEDTTPTDFQNLRSFNSHEHTPSPPADLKTVVDEAISLGKWANLVFHQQCNDDGAIAYAAARDIWIAPVGSVVKYILQRDRFVLDQIRNADDKLSLSVRRLELPTSSKMDFEDRLGKNDLVTLSVDLGSANASAVRVDGIETPFEVELLNGANRLLVDLPLRPASSTVDILYAKNYSLTVDRSGTGTVTSSPSGISCGTTCSAPFGNGTSVDLGATPGNGYLFAGWGGACSGTGACKVTMNGAQRVAASFTAIPKFTLTVTRSGNGIVTSSPGGINCGSDCREPYTQGTEVTLTATPSSGYFFAGWSGTSCSGTTPCKVTMDAARQVTATFSAVPKYTLTVTRSGKGSVTSDPPGIACGKDCRENYASGTQVRLTATANSGHSFAGWGAGCGELEECVLTLSGVRTVTATFTR